MRTRWLDVVVVLLVAAGAALRWVHLGAASLWWDEVVEIAMAQVGSLAAMLDVVRHGVPWGSGNAGAMPLDYLLLRGWLAVAPASPPALLEIHFRFPAFVWSVAALVAFAGFARRHLRRDVGVVALLLLVLSIPHVLYAAEVRWYSLLVLVTVGHLWAFARLLDAPAAPRRWLVWLVLAVASLLTALLSVVPLGIELLVLAVRRRQALGAVLASAAVLALLGAWLAVPSLGVAYGRPDAARPGQLATAALVLRFLAGDDPLLLAAAAVGVWLAWRQPPTDRDARPALLAVLVLCFVAIPLVTTLARVKTYYVHPRHLLFLLPAFVVLAALGLVGACRLVAGRRWAPAVAVALVGITELPTIARYVADPEPFFARTKPLRDVRGVAAAVASFPPGAPWLLLAERESVPNMLLDRYLHWWGIADRVVFRGTRDVPEALRLLADPQLPLDRLAAPPLATIPVGLTGELRALLEITADPTPPATPLGGAVVVVWNPPAAVPAEGLERESLLGVTTFRRAP